MMKSAVKNGVTRVLLNISIHTIKGIVLVPATFTVSCDVRNAMLSAEGVKQFLLGKQGYYKSLNAPFDLQETLEEFTKTHDANWGKITTMYGFIDVRHSRQFPVQLDCEKLGKKIEKQIGVAYTDQQTGVVIDARFNSDTYPVEEITPILVEHAKYVTPTAVLPDVAFALKEKLKKELNARNTNIVVCHRNNIVVIEE